MWWWAGTSSTLGANGSDNKIGWQDSTLACAQAM